MSGFACHLLQSIKSVYSNAHTYDYRSEILSDNQSIEAYYDRVSSYKLSMWHGISTELSPLICARYGWQCVDKNHLKCVACKESLFIATPKKREINQEESERSGMLENLAGRHTRSCSWRYCQSPDTFCRPLYLTQDPKETFKKFSDYIDQLLLCCASVLPIIKFDFSHFEDEDALIKAYKKKSKEYPNFTSQQIECAMIIVLAGWCLNDTKTKSPSTLKCTLCQRIIGLWNFPSLTSDNDKSSSEDVPQCENTVEQCSNSTDTEHDPSAECSNDDPTESAHNNTQTRKRKSIVDKESEATSSTMPKRRQPDAFDPIHNHWYWCPWYKWEQTKHFLQYLHTAPIVFKDSESFESSLNEDYQGSMLNVLKDKSRTFQGFLERICRAKV